MEEIHDRLREALNRQGISLVAAAKAAGEKNPQGLRDVVTGRKRLTADLLARLAATGIDARYVLTGQQPHQLAEDRAAYGGDIEHPSPEEVLEGLKCLMNIEQQLTNPGLLDISGLSSDDQFTVRMLALMLLEKSKAQSKEEK